MIYTAHAAIKTESVIIIHTKMKDHTTVCSFIFFAQKRGWIRKGVPSLRTVTYLSVKGFHAQLRYDSIPSAIFSALAYIDIVLSVWYNYTEVRFHQK